MNLWADIEKEGAPTLEYFPAEKKTAECAVIIFPGGGYTHLAVHEGAGYAKMLNVMGIDAFVLNYSVAPYSENGEPLKDAQRAVKFVRERAEEYGINPQKIGVMGSSAGGHLAALVSAYKEKFDESLDTNGIDFRPNFQILCYPVMDFFDEKIVHIGSAKNFIRADYTEKEAKRFSPNRIADSTCPPAFVWHTAEDATVSMIGSLEYVKRLKENNVSVELHIFPHGSHGLGVAYNMHCGRWSSLMYKWLVEMNFI